LRFSDSDAFSLGQDVVAAGYNVLGQGPPALAVTTGRIRGTVGLHGDARMLQITAPVAPGADGGPLLDRGGNVIGVILSELSPLHPETAARDINFALKASVVRSFLESAGAGYLTAPPAAAMDSAAAEEAARRSTVMVECWR